MAGGDRLEARNGEQRQGLLKISEVAEAAGVPVATIKHYLREGLLPEPVKTSRNMAWYQPESVERVRLIKRLQTERFMPLEAIRNFIENEPERAEAILEIEDRILERAMARTSERIPQAEVTKRYEMPLEVLERLEEIGILSPDERGYGPFDVKIIEAISRFRAGGYDEKIGFTVYDTLRYRRAIEELVAQEVAMVKERLAGEFEAERVVEMLEAGAEPLEDLIAALHTKLLLAELERERHRG
jgi:DNA-binding transcriptional MerR regulator